MNKMLFPEGGVPLSLDDLQFMQDSNSDMLRRLCLSIGGEKNFILEGCNVNESKVSWDDGSVFLGGEIHSVKAGALTKQDKTLYWKVRRMQDTRVTLKNGVTAYLHQSSEATLTYEVTPADEKYEYDSSKSTVHDLLVGNPQVEVMLDTNNTQGSIYISRYKYAGLDVYYFDGTLYRNNIAAGINLSSELGGRLDQNFFCALGRYMGNVGVEYQYAMVYVDISHETLTMSMPGGALPQNIYFNYRLVIYN